MRIAIATHNLVRGDGQGRVNLHIAHEALSRGHRVVLIATRVDQDLADHPEVEWARVPVSGWPTQLLKNQIFAARATLALHRCDPNAVLACGFTCWSRTDLNAAHLVHSSWWRSPVHTRHLRRGPYGWYQGAYTVANAALERVVFRRARAVVAVSRLVANQLDGVVPPGIPIHTIHNGVDPVEFAPGAEARAQLGLPEEGLLALFVGDIKSPRKNLDGVLRALVGVPRLHLAVAGDPTGSPYPQLANSLGIAERVTFLGFRDDIPRLLRAADIFVFPSRYEPFSLVVLEAMASGVPVVTAATVGATELVGDAGIVLDDPDDVAGLRNALVSLAADATLREEMGTAGRARAEQHTFQRMAAEYLDLLESLAGTTRGAAGAGRT